MIFWRLVHLPFNEPEDEIVHSLPPIPHDTDNPEILFPLNELFSVRGYKQFPVLMFSNIEDCLRSNISLASKNTIS